MKQKIFEILLTLLAKSWSIKVEGTMPHAPAILAFWHGTMMPVWYLFSNRVPVGVVSPSKDGAILSGVLNSWGINCIRGSSHKNPKETLNKIVETAKSNIVMLTPDGPRGPRNKFKSGAAVASYRSGSPLHLVKVKPNNTFTFSKSWDKFSLPLPFSKIYIEISEPFFLPASLSRPEIDERINFFESYLNSNLEQI